MRDESLQIPLLSEVNDMFDEGISYESIGSMQVTTALHPALLRPPFVYCGLRQVEDLLIGFEILKQLDPRE